MKRRPESRRSSYLQRPCEYNKLENRELLASISIDAAGQLMISGTNGPDSAEISLSQGRVTVSQAGESSTSFDASDVKSVFFIGRRGDDTFTNRTSIASFAYGGAGNDRLTGGSGNDVLVGNAGNDILDGGSGRDNLVAGAGNDQLLGGSGEDVLVGGAGGSTLDGGADNDVVYGGTGSEEILGGSGSDVINGGAGNDRISAGAGNDHVSAGAGNDTIDGGQGNDVLNGQQGNDVITPGGGEDLAFGEQGNDMLNFERAEDAYEVVNGGSGSFSVTDMADASRDELFGVEGVAFGGVSTATDAVASQPITHRVTVQPIVVANNNASNVAVSFGTVDNERAIKGRVDQIFGQIGIDIAWLGAHRWNNSFANIGNGQSRSVQELATIVSRGDAAGAGNADARISDLYFVRNVPGGNQNGGASYVGRSGSAITVNAGDLLSEAGREATAREIAHAIAQNLGLLHVTTSGNLLERSPQGIALTSQQATTMKASSLSVQVAASQPPVSTINRKITLNPIIVSNNDGSQTAIGFGSTDRERAIKARIRQIFAQAGVDVVWLSTKNFRDTYANTGSPSNGASFQGLRQIFDAGNAAGVGRPDSRIIDLYFVTKLVGRQGTAAGSVAGLSVSGATNASLENKNGVTVSLGTGFRTGNPSAIARLIAHEIGHNLGLTHAGAATGNLAVPAPPVNLSDNSIGLTQAQIATIRSSGFVTQK